MARTVQLRLNYSQRGHHLIDGPSYTITEDPPWLQNRSYSADAIAEPRASSTYSVQLDDLLTADMAEAAQNARQQQQRQQQQQHYSSSSEHDSFSSSSPPPPLTIMNSNNNNTPAITSSTSTTNNNYNRDSAVAAQSRSISTPANNTSTTRLPIFKQVRSMLTNNRGASAGNNTSPTSAAIKWDAYSGEISENGMEAKVKPSNYKNPYEGLLKPRRQVSPTRGAEGRQQNDHHHHHHLQLGRNNEARGASPVSMLVDEDMQTLEREKEHSHMSPPNSRPVSPVSAVGAAPVEHHIAPMYIEPHVTTRPKTSGAADGRMKRKPVAAAAAGSTSSPHHEDPFPQADAMRIMPNSSHGEPSQHSHDPESRFSWTTAAQSDAAALRRSTDTRFSKQHDYDSPPQQYDNSHFSWSTVASSAAIIAPGAARVQTPPPSPPPVPPQYLEPPVYGPPPTQSILSRQRPYKRIEKPEWAPPPAPATEGYTPRSLTPKVHRVEEHWSTTPTLDGKKRLPLPPLFTEKSLSHLEALLTQEKNVLLQRRNIERSIYDLERIENASPLEVSFSQVREARKKLEEQRKVLDEIRLEEMDIGIKIARARRKEDFGDGEGTFWVRRVTG